jgi:hypothetical protein
MEYLGYRGGFGFVLRFLKRAGRWNIVEHSGRCGLVL